MVQAKGLPDFILKALQAQQHLQYNVEVATEQE
jgi:hypothetical protein